MIDAKPIGALLLEDGGHLSAASGLVALGPMLHVIADDDWHLGRFDATLARPGRVVPLLPEGEAQLPDEPAARKAAKPDFEALARLPGFAAHPFGALLALGSGSTAKRHRAVLVAIDASGAVGHHPTVLDLAPLLEPLQQRFAQLNIEGAFVCGHDFCLLQRGNRGAAQNACVRFAWGAVARFLNGDGPAPTPHAIDEFALGDLDGVPLGFTDGAALPGGGFVFTAAAEDTADRYLDGDCAGSVIGLVDADGALHRIEPLKRRCKVEGIAARLAADGGLRVLLVTDADDRAAPAQLLEARIERAMLRIPASRLR